MGGGDHPRSRGGNTDHVVRQVQRGGPSPLARGKPRPHSPCALAWGTIPARAGETGCGFTPFTMCRDHPRSRGGNFLPYVVVGLGEGPSPLARGKLARALVVVVDKGTIPARAGETAPDAHGHIGLGTIPARAGETVRMPASIMLITDHPRSRGGNVGQPVEAGCVQGPSPLARGKPGRQACHVERHGTIPARAGETADGGSGERGSGDHPRSRGGNVIALCRVYGFLGPSPLARGKRWAPSGSRKTQGTIPARAGETRFWPTASLVTRDHPRSRGGNIAQSTPACFT